MQEQRRGETMKLGAFFHPTGNHVAAWLHPETQIDAGTNFRHYAEITQTAERGKFDLMFVADAVATRDGKLEQGNDLDPEMMDKEAKADQARMAEQHGGFEMLRRREKMAFTPPPTA